jgi:flagellar assembly protein FliH
MSPEATTFRLSALAAVTPRTSSDRAEGYAAGWAAGMQAATEEAARLRAQLQERNAVAEASRAATVARGVAALERAARAIETSAVPVVAEARRSLYEAAIALAEAVLGHELASGPGSATEALARALAAPADLGVRSVRLCPEDAAQVRALVSDGVVTLPAGIEIVPDGRLRPGDAIGEHPTGYVDARIAAALARAQAELLGEEGA